MESAASVFSRLDPGGDIPTQSLTGGHKDNKCVPKEKGSFRMRDGYN